MKSLRWIIYGVAAILIGIRLIGCCSDILDDADGIIRLVLGLVFSVVILVRGRLQEAPGGPIEPQAGIPASAIIGPAVAGAFLSLLGIITHTNQFEWLGLLLLLYATLRWGLPPRYARDVFLALFLFYWVHPVPTQVFGPLQLWARTVSIAGAERLLTWLSVPVWADEFALRTGFRVFTIPGACSGMRTVMTVLFCVLGLGLLLRMRWYQVVTFLLLGVLQVLAANVLRIAAVIFWSSRLEPGDVDAILHDSLGLFLLGCIVLVNFEMTWWRAAWKRRKTVQEQIETGAAEPPDRGTFLPHNFRLMMRVLGVVMLVIPVAAGIVFVVWKRGPEHRHRMLHQVADGLLKTDPVNAERLTAQALTRWPDDRDLRSKRVYALMFKGRFNDALAELNELGTLSVPEEVMKSWALMATRREAEAIRVLDGLPGYADDLPGVAILRAEYAARHGQPRTVAEQIVRASRAASLRPRVRALFPYLAGHAQWAAIVSADNIHVPYADIFHCLSAVQAYLKLNRSDLAGLVLRKGLEQWPGDLRFLGVLHSMALAAPSTFWETQFGEILAANRDKLDADEIGTCMTYCIRLRRSDWMWPLYLQLQAKDPAHPSLHVVPGRFAESWLAFRHHQLGLPAENARQEINLAGLFRVTRHVRQFKDFWNRVPLAQRMSGSSMKEVRKGHLEAALAELARREQAGKLSPYLRMLYPSVLASTGRHKEAHERLTALEASAPDLQEEVLYQRAALYDQRSEWQNAYEALRRYSALGIPSISAKLMQLNALLQLRQGVLAEATVHKLVATFPDSREACEAAAALWYYQGFREQALFTLEQDRERSPSLGTLRLLYETGRYDDAETLARALRVRALPRSKIHARDEARLQPAELTVARAPARPWDRARLDKAVVELEKEIGEAASPFIRRQKSLESGWYRSGASVQAIDFQQWEQAGRDPAEKAALLNRLSALLARQGESAAAEAAAFRASEVLPESRMLRWCLIAMSEGTPEYVKKAYEDFPHDPQVWLAYLVSETRARSAAGGNPPPASRTPPRRGIIAASPNPPPASRTPPRRGTLEEGEGAAPGAQRDPSPVARDDKKMARDDRKMARDDRKMARDDKKMARDDKKASQNELSNQRLPRRSNTKPGINESTNPESSNHHLSAWAEGEIRKAVESGQFSVATMVRAGDWFLRQGLVGAASLAAKDAMDRSSNYLPASVLALVCALERKDRMAAVKAALAAADDALDPSPFHRIIVNLKIETGDIDGEMVASLQYLKERYPGQTQWTEVLGAAHFERGDTSRVLSILGPVVDRSIGELRKPSLILTAEAARLEGDLSRAVKILERAYASYPEELAMLNNLVYTIAASGRNLGRARELLPKLLETENRAPEVLDTVAMVYLKSGDPKRAGRYITEALERMNERTYAALEIRLNAAEIMLELGRRDEARHHAEVIIRDPNSPGAVNQRARKILEIVKEREADAVSGKR